MKYRLSLCILCFSVSLWFNLSFCAAQTLGRTDPNKGLFPDSSLADFRFLLDAPAGKYGFLKTDSSGHFVWPNGKRAKFWGVNISNRSVWTDKSTIDKVVDVLARAGTNMVRFEALDSTGGLLDAANSKSSRALDKQKLDTLDYWTARLRARGIYYYLDLLDFREFKQGDEVPQYDLIGRAAKPYAFFDPRLIDLQKEFAGQLLLHRNAYTKLRYVDDPALALLEICNEHGLFFKAEQLDSLVEPYGAELRQTWNRWLLKQYGNRDGIKAAWGSLNGVVVLGDQEDPGAYSVMLPNFAAPTPPNATEPASAVIDVRRAPNRLRDGVRFLYEVQRAYFADMKAALRDMGLKIPVTAVVSNEFAPDLASVAAEMDFTSENYYADHPAFAGKDWEGMFFYNDTNPLRKSSPYQIAPWLAALRWENKPVVVREWATVWPNRYRAIAVPEMAAYASLQDFDAVLLFGYQIARDPDQLSDFDHQADPTVWGLYALGALTFLRGDINPAPYAATLAYTPETLFRWPNLIGNLHRLAWFVRLNSAFQATPPAPKPVTAAKPSGRKPTKSARAGRGSAKSAIRNPQSAIANPLPVWPGDSTALNRILDRYGAAGLPISRSALEAGSLVASSRQIMRRTDDGLLFVSTPRALAVCGELPANKPVTIGDWTLVTPTGIGAFMAVSLDGKPLSESQSFVLKMVSRAENTGQSLEEAPSGAPAHYHIKTWGKAPILTFGRQSKQAVRVLRNGKSLVSIALQDGTWEVLVRNNQATLACDTPGIRGTLYSHSFTTSEGIAVTVDTHPGKPAASAKAASAAKP